MNQTGDLFDDLAKPPEDWTRGFALDRLKAAAAPFRASKPYVYGGFGIAKERDVAAAMAEGAYLCDREEAPTVAAITRRLKTGAIKKDFRGEEIRIPEGDAVTWDIGAAEGAYPNDIAEILVRSRSHAPAHWVEWFEEDRRGELLASLGYQWIATRIAAGSEIKGIYRYGQEPRLWRDKPLADADRAAVACLDAGFLSGEERAEIIEELKNAEWAQHYSNYNKRSTWTAFALRGYDAEDPSFIIKPAEMSASWKNENPQRMSAQPQWTNVGAFSCTRSILARLGDDFDRVRFMRLAAGGGELTRHADITDRDAGTADGRIARLHIPITTRPSCVFSSWGIRGAKYDAHFPEGSLCYLDQRRPHAVRNPEAIDRIHLVVDVHADQSLRDRFLRASWRRDD
jgi:hypothetical protein